MVRIFNTYGPRMHPNDGRVVSNFIVQALRGDDITIYGDGSQTRAFCFVDDLVEAMIRMMATGPEVTGPINIGNPGEFSIRVLADQVVDLTGSRSKIVHRALPSDDPRQRKPDISQAQAVLGWEPTVALRKASSEPSRFRRVDARGPPLARDEQRVLVTGGAPDVSAVTPASGSPPQASSRSVDNLSRGQSS